MFLTHYSNMNHKATLHKILYIKEVFSLTKAKGSLTQRKKNNSKIAKFGKKDIAFFPAHKPNLTIYKSSHRPLTFPSASYC